MRLIDCDTHKLSNHLDDSNIPPYAILSHTWGPNETTLQDVTTLPPSELSHQKGYIKITNFCHVLKTTSYLLPRPVQYVWVDTCCIDKTSSAELNEAINSMFRWYREAKICYAYLSDVDKDEDFEKSRWFTRGWTLQELLAPRELHFFNEKWRYMGDREHFAHRIAARTNIEPDILISGQWDGVSIAQRMSWASSRVTTRKEDLAYCLLGIFDVNMPLIYGEGERAFIRLQEEIMKESDDESIFAWDAGSKDQRLASIGALATHPSYFAFGAGIESVPSRWEPAVLTSRGIRGHFQIIKIGSRRVKTLCVVLNCRGIGDMNSRIGICVRRDDMNATELRRTPQDLVNVPLCQDFIKEPPICYLIKRDAVQTRESVMRRCWLRFSELPQNITPNWPVPSLEWYMSSDNRSMTLPLPRSVGDGSENIVSRVTFKIPEIIGALWVVMILDPIAKRGWVVLRFMTHEDMVGITKGGMDVNSWITETENMVQSSEASLKIDSWGELFAKVFETASSFHVSLSAKLEGAPVEKSTVGKKPKPKRVMKKKKPDITVEVTSAQEGPDSVKKQPELRGIMKKSGSDDEETSAQRSPDSVEKKPKSRGAREKPDSNVKELLLREEHDCWVLTIP